MSHWSLHINDVYSTVTYNVYNTKYTHHITVLHSSHRVVVAGVQSMNLRFCRFENKILI